MKVLLSIGVLMVSMTFVGCGKKAGVIAAPEDVNQYNTPPEAMQQMKEAQEAEAGKRP